MKQHLASVGKCDDWLTPPEIIKVLGPFDLDPCASLNQPWRTAHMEYTVKDDGLSKDWFGRVWLNPPWNRYERPKWMAKMATHKNGIMLIPMSGETKDWAKYVWGECSGLLIMNKRPHFYYPSVERAGANSGCTVSLIAYGSENFKTLKDSGLGYSLLEV